MSLEQIIQLKLSRLQSVPESFINALNKTEKEFYAKLLKLISRLQMKDGKFILSKSNLDVTAQIESQLKNIFLDTDFKTQVKKFIGEFDTQAGLNKSYFQKTFPEASIPQIASDLLLQKKTSVATLLLGDTLDANFINPIRTQLNLAVESAASFTDTLKVLQDIVTGSPEVDSKIVQYAKQVAYDSFAVSDRTFTKSISDELDAQWFKWSGDVIPTSRTICVENHNKFFHKKEIEAMADLDWSGKMEGTNEQTIFVTAGGYHCLHSILPVSLFAVPMDVVQRNISSGNFEPTEKELELLGIAA